MDVLFLLYHPRPGLKGSSCSLCNRVGWGTPWLAQAGRMSCLTSRPKGVYPFAPDLTPP